MEKSIDDLEKEMILESIKDAQNGSWVLSSWEDELKQMAECIKLLGINKNELFHRQVKAYHFCGEDILKVKEELLKDNIESDRVILKDSDEIDKYLKT